MGGIYMFKIDTLIESNDDIDLVKSFKEYTVIDEETGFKRNPIVISEDDIYINFDKFVSKKEHVLLITGLSGGGKSTLGKKMAEKYNAYYVEMDVIGFKICMKPERIDRCNWEYIESQDKMLAKYMREKGLKPDFMMKYTFENYDNALKHDWEQDQVKYIKWLIDDQKERVVIGGGAVGFFLKYHPEYAEKPTIFKGTSLFKSILRRINRSGISRLASIPVLFSQYKKMLGEINISRYNVMSKNEWKYVKEATDIEQKDVILRIEKSYYETNESNQQQESIQRKTCGIKCFKRYDNINIFFIRIFLILTIQYILITSIILLIIYIYKYESYIKGNIVIQIIGIIMIIASICIHIRILLMKEKRRSSKTLYIYVVFYIPSIVFNFLLFQSFVKDYIIIYIIIILITKTIDFFGLLLYILFFTFKSFKFMIVPVITSILAIIFFHFWLNINLNNSFIALILALIECIYIEVISRQCKLYFKKMIIYLQH
jgi:hypothetical protein